MKFCFQRRDTHVTQVWFDADTEAEAWTKALDNHPPSAIGDERIPNKPIFRRDPNQDEFDL